MAGPRKPRSAAHSVSGVAASAPPIPSRIFTAFSTSANSYRWSPMKPSNPYWESLATPVASPFSNDGSSRLYDSVRTYQPS